MQDYSLMLLNPTNPSLSSYFNLGIVIVCGNDDKLMESTKNHGICNKKITNQFDRILLPILDYNSIFLWGYSGHFYSVGNTQMTEAVVVSLSTYILQALLVCTKWRKEKYKKKN